VSRRAAIAVVAVALTGAGCGGGRPSGEPVNALMRRYLVAMMTRDWATACAQLTPEAAEARHRSAPSADCPGALAFESGANLVNPPPYLHLHPELAGREFEEVRIQHIEMRDHSAQIDIETHPGEEIILLAVRRGGRWLLAQDLAPGIPVVPPLQP